MIIYNGKYKVYVHTNKINNKMYVGITKQKVENRWNNGYGYKDSPHFYNAILKYGWNNFEHDVYADNLTKEEACNMEQLLIKLFNLQDPNYGYNIKYGGEVHSIPEETKKKIGDANREKKASKETRKKLSEAHKGRKHTSEERRKISEGNRGVKKPSSSITRKNLSGEKHHFYGKHLSEEHRQKVSNSLQKHYKIYKMKPRNEKKVLQIETNVIFDSIEKAAQIFHTCRSSISECCSGKRKSAGGFHWKFVS